MKVGRREMRGLRGGRSDLLLEGSRRGPGGGVGGGRLDRLVGHDACSELLLGLLEAGAGGTVHRVDLFEHDEGHDSQRGKQSGDENHYDAHWDAPIQASQSRDPPTGAPTGDADTLEDVDAKLTDVHEEENKKPERTVTPESSIKWSVPTDERAGCEEQEPEDGQAEVHPASRIHAEPGEAADHVGQQRPSMKHPEVVHDLNRLLKLYRNVHGDVVVETGAHWELLWEGGPVVFPAS